MGTDPVGTEPVEPVGTDPVDDVGATPDGDDLTATTTIQGRESDPSVSSSVATGTGQPEPSVSSIGQDPDADEPVASTTSAPATVTTMTSSTTTTTTTATTTSTTLAPGIEFGGRLFLLASGPGDQIAQSPLPLGSQRPADGPLFNYDTDRDDAPGMLLARDAAGVSGTDPAKVQSFRTSFSSTQRVQADVIVGLYVAAKDLARKDVHIQVQVLNCSPAGPCEPLLTGDKFARNADGFKKITIPLGVIDTSVPLGSQLELRIAVLDDSDDDAWIAFGTRDLDADVRFND